MSETKKKRGKNFSDQEAEILINLVEEHKSIIENKKWKEKERCWNRIATVFAATSGVARDSKALKDKYDVLKRQSRAELAAEKRETYRTGGGSSEIAVSNVSKQIAALLGDSATGMTNAIDSDKATCTDVISYSTDIEDVECEVDPAEREVVPPEREAVPPEDNSSSSNWDSWSPKDLKMPKSKRLCVGGQRKRSFEEMKMDLVASQKLFYDDENRRAQEKHDEELTALQIKNELLKIKLLKAQKEMNGSISQYE